MKAYRIIPALLLFAAPSLGAQRAVAVELGVFAQYSKFDDFTALKDGIGAGARFGVYPLRNIALEYEGDFTVTSSARLGRLTSLNNRIDAIFYFPLSGRLHLLAGGGWTGTQYHTDTTKNQYDSGGNAVVGVKYCLSEDWAWRADVAADFKDPSDQTSSGQRTTTYNVRLGISRFLGGRAKNSPCYEPPPAPPAPVPAPAPPPAPVPQPQPTKAPEPTQAAPVLPPAPPAPAPAKPREIFKLEGVLFDFNKSTLTKLARTNLGAAVTYLKANPNTRVEIQAHTDSKGSEAYNQKLSERRAASVLAFLKENGIDAGRMTTRGFGKDQPVADNATDEGRALNRRAVIIELP